MAPSKRCAEPKPGGGASDDTQNLRDYIYGGGRSGDQAPPNEFDVTVGQGTTMLRGEGMDQSALHGAFNRLQNLGLELLQVTTSEPPRLDCDT